MSNRSNSWFIAVTLLLAGSFFSRAIRDSFDLSKATIIALSGCFLIGTLVVKRPVVSDRLVWWAAGSLAVSVTTTSVASQNRWMSFVGQPMRYTGFFVLISAIAVFVICSSLRERVDMARVMRAYLVAVLVNSVYCLVQFSGSDPWQWSTSSFGVAVFGTIGNPNTSSFFTAAALPFAFFHAFDRENSVIWRFISSATFGIGAVSLAPLASFQGNIALLFVGVGAFAVLLRTLGPSVELGAATAVWAVAVGSSFWSTTETRAIISALIVGVMLFTVGSTQRTESDSVGSVRVRPATWVIGLSVAAVIGVLLRGRIREGLAGGFIERGDFYRAAWKAFANSPFLGSGFETFGLVFTELRSVGHAVRLEDNRTTSVHSIPLAMFQSGGLLLGISFLFVLVLVSWRAIALLRRVGSGSMFDWGLSLTWFAIVILSTVSVEHVSNYLVLFAVGGLVIARCAPRLDAPRRLSVSERMRGRVALVVGLLVLVISSVFTTRPFRSELAERRAQEALARGDGTAALSAFDDAVELLPGDFFLLAQRAEIRLRGGFPEAAIDDAVRAAELSGYSAVLTLNAAVVAANAGAYQTASELVVEAIRNDPLAPKVRSSGLDLMDQIANAADQSGQVSVGEAVRAAAREVSRQAGS